MNRDFKKEIRGKKSKFCLLKPLISPRKAIVDHPQEEEEEDQVEGEEEAVDAEDSPRMTKTKKRENHLINLKSSVITVRKWVILLMSVIQIQRRKEKKRRLTSQRKPKRNGSIL